MFRTLFGSSQVRCEVQKFIMKFTCKFVNKTSNCLLEQEQPIKCSVYKLVCESHYELLNFTTNLRISERSSEHLRENLSEIDCNHLLKVVVVAIQHCAGKRLCSSSGAYISSSEEIHIQIVDFY